MLDGREMCGIEDKAVSTSDDPIMICNASDDSLCNEEMEWNIVTVEKLITTLMNTKMIALRTMDSIENLDYYDSSESSSYSFKGGREKDLSSRSHDHRHHSSRHHHHHHHQCSKKIKHEKQNEERSSINKVQKWSDDGHMETSFNSKCQDEEKYQEQSVVQKTKPSKDGSTLVDMEPKTLPKKRKRKRRKKRVEKIMSQVDPEDLPTRARWTIIITSGILILTCMFLVGVTLRMAPVIDEMVRSQNEELMNSLNRETNPAYYSSMGWGGPRITSENNEEKFKT